MAMLSSPSEPSTIVGPSAAEPSPTSESFSSHGAEPSKVIDRHLFSKPNPLQLPPSVPPSPTPPPSPIPPPTPLAELNVFQCRY